MVASYEKLGWVAVFAVILLVVVLQSGCVSDQPMGEGVWLGVQEMEEGR